MTTNQKVLAGLGLAAAVYVAYRYSKKGSIFGKSNMSGEYYESLRNIPQEYVSDREAVEGMSNATGTMCRCDNGFVGRCESGDCSKCCGSYNKPKQEQRRYKF